MRPLLFVLVLVACDSAPVASEPAPAPEAIDQAAVEICAVMTEQLPAVCSGLGMRAARCRATSGTVTVNDRETAAGHRVTFGDVGPMWFVDEQRDVFAANDEAEAACPDMLTVEDLVRATARAEAAAGVSKCSAADLEIAMDIARRLDAVNGAMERGLLSFEDAQRGAIGDTAQALGLDRSVVQGAWDRVFKICPEAL